MVQIPSVLRVVHEYSSDKGLAVVRISSETLWQTELHGRICTTIQQSQVPISIIIKISTVDTLYTVIAKLTNSHFDIERKRNPRLESECLGQLVQKRRSPICGADCETSRRIHLVAI